MDRWRSFSSAVSPGWLFRFPARSLCLLFSRFVAISLARSPYGSRSLARWIHSFALSPARSISRFFALSLSYSFALSFFLVLPVSLACLLAFSLPHLLAFSLVRSLPGSRSPAFVELSLVLALYRSPAWALALCRVFALMRGLLCADSCLQARCFEMI